jgi:hypothetical protein
MEPIIGKTYKVRSAGGQLATPIARVFSDRYLFVKHQWDSSTPFVSWCIYDIDNENGLISCGSGNYYKDLPRAIEKEQIK